MSLLLLSAQTPTGVLLSTTGTTLTVTGLQAGKQYRVEVRAVGAGGRSAYSAPITVTPTEPAAVTGTATSTLPTFAQAATGVVSPPGAVLGTATSTLPTFTQAATGTFTPASTTTTYPATGTTLTVTGLTASSNYTAQVRALNAAGQSTLSDAVPFTTTAVGQAAPTVTAGRARPVARGSSVALDSTVGGGQVDTSVWSVVSGGGSVTGAVYSPPGTGAGLAVLRHTVTGPGGTASSDLTVAYDANIVAAENRLTGTARATWDLPTNLLGGVTTLQGFADGFSFDKTETVNFKIAQSDAAGWNGEVFRLGYYGDTGARSYGGLTTSNVATSQAQPTPGDADAVTTKLSADCGNWSVTGTWTPPAWAPSGIYVLRLNRTGGGASHVMFLLRDDARVADVTLMPSDSTWNAYNAFGGMGANLYTGNSVYFGTAVDQYNSDCARFVSYNRPIVNRGSLNVAYGQVQWSTFFTGEYPMVRFLERNGYDAKYLACIDAAGDPTGTKLIGKTKTAMYVGHNEYWSDGMRAGWEAAKAAGVNIFACAGNDVFWRLVGSNNDSAGRPRTWECYKSTIAGRNSTGRAEWTGTWRDPDGAGKGGNAPENTFAGSIFVVNGPSFHTLQVPTTGGYREQPLWRNTTVATGTYTSPSQILGFEWNVPGQGFVSTGANAFLAPVHAQVRYCSTATHSIGSGVLLTDAGDVYDAAGTATHRLTVHPNGANGGMTFSTGSINYALGLDNANTYQLGNDNTSLPLQQATVNMLRDMLAAPATPMAGITVSDPVVWYFTGTATSVLPTFGQSATGTATSASSTGTATSVLPAFAQAATATSTVPVFTGTASSAFPTFGQASAGSVTAPAFVGTAASSLPSFAQTATATSTAPQYTATAASVLPTFAQAAAGTVTAPGRTGTAASTLSMFQQAATGTASVPAGSGVANSVLPTFTQAATGTFVNTPGSPGTPVAEAMDRTGTAASVLPGFTQGAVGTFTMQASASAASVLPAFGQAAAGSVTVPVFTGSAASVLPSFTQAAVETLSRVATAHSTMALLAQAAVGTFTASGATGDDVALTVAQALLDKLVLALGTSLAGPVARAAVYPGEETAPMDECCAGQAAVRVYRLFPVTGRFPQQNHGPKNCSETNSYGITLEMTVYRCAAVLQSDGSPPDAWALTENSAEQLSDALAMRRAIRALAAELALAPYGGSPMYVEDDYNPVGPAGDCLGGRQRCTFPIYDLG